MFGRRLLVRRPSPRLAEGLLTHLDRTPVDTDLAMAQWQAYCDAFAAEGWQIVEAPATASPDGVFVEDVVVVYGDVAVLPRLGAPERRVESEGMAELMRSLGYIVHELTEPATLDGGDVLKHDHLVRIGLSGRTNRAGVRQLAGILEERGARVVATPVTKTLHLKSQVTALPSGQVIGWPGLVDDRQLYPNLLPVPEPEGAHVIVLDDSTVLMSASAPRTAALLRGECGLRVVTVDISEFERLEGCVTCLSVRLRA